MAKPSKFVSPPNASEHVLSDGRVLTPWEPVELDADALKDEHNKRLIEEGQIVEVKEGKSTSTSSGGE